MCGALCQAAALVRQWHQHGHAARLWNGRLIWSAMPGASVDEVREAILGSADPIPGGDAILTAGGLLDAAAAIRADVFAPTARLVAKEDITTGGGTSTEFTVEYSHRSGIDTSTLGDDDLQVTRKWGGSDPIPVQLKSGTITSDATTATASYVIDAPGSAVFSGPPATAFDDTRPRRFESSAPRSVQIGVNPGVIESRILVEGITDPVSNFTVSVDIEHSYDEDLAVFLLAPDDTLAVLFSQVGGAGDNFRGTTFDDNAATSIVDGMAPFTGTFRAQDSLSPLLAGDPNGFWTLAIFDLFPSSDAGLLVDWSLEFPPPANVPARTISQVLVENVSETVGNFTVGLDIEHPSVQDLTATLVAPDGSRRSCSPISEGTNLISPEPCLMIWRAHRSRTEHRASPEFFSRKRVSSHLALRGQTVCGRWSWRTSMD